MKITSEVSPEDFLIDLGRDFQREALSDICSGYAAFRPPKRVTVAEGAAATLVIKQPGGYSGPWSPDEAPYMVEPMNEASSRTKEAVCFVGPARTGKTAGLIVGWMSHTVVNDPGDMIIVQMTQDKAREFSKTDIDRALRHSPKLKAMMGRSQDDNTHDKAFKHGMWLRIAWPTVSNLSGSTYRYVALTDYDRMPDDIDGEGPAFDLGLKRTTTFMSRGMCVVESSPGRPLEDPNWQPTTPHEAPPTKGILGIYNRSDLRRWYWKCPHCGAWFEAKPGLELFMLPDEDELMERVREEDIEEMVKQYNRIVCPASGCIIGPSKKNPMNATGRWVAEGQYFDADDNLVGKPRSSTIAGFWMGGVAAAYQNWRSLLGNYFQALRTYALSGDEGPLQKTVNTDQGMPYMSRLLSEAARRAVNPRDRKEKKMQRYIVPDETRFVTAQVDVQGGINARFVVQVHAHGPHNEQWVVDRYAITESNREGMGGKAPIDPAQHPEDWDVLTERVVLATYRTSIEGTEIRVKMTAVDSGGEHKAKKVGERRAEGVTVNAYDWYRRLRRKGLHNRVMLVKGASSKDAPLIKETLVGNRNPREKGDVPLYVINPNLLKDVVSTGLKRPLPGPGYIHLPSWLPDAFFDELQAEIRNPDGTWTQRKARNEAFDLAAYGQATRLRLGADKINWQRPPDWAKPIFEGNIEVITREERREMKADEEYSEVDDEPSEVIEDTPNTPQPAAPPPVVRKVARRTARSSYLR